MYSDEEAQIWLKQTLKQKEEEIYEKSFKVEDEEGEFEFLDDKP